MPERAIAVICVDRDNDFGRKAGINGPIIGRKDNLRAAVKLALADPTDSDANCLFAAIQRYDELKEKYERIEIVTFVGSKKFGFESDVKINDQLDEFMEQFHAEQFVLVTDGAEDDQIIPILQSRAPILSKQIVIVKQAREVESTYYTIKEALKDPFLARLVFGAPGLVILLYLLSPTIGLQLVAGLFGVYLILKGFGLEEKLLSGIKEVASSINAQRVSFPFYIGAILIIAFGIFSSGPPLYRAYLEYNAGELVASMQSASVGMDFVLLFGMVTVLAYLVGKGADAVQLKRAYLLRTYLLTAVGVIMGTLLFGTAKGVLVGTTTLNWFLVLLPLTFLFFFAVYKVTNVLDIRKRVTRLLIGLPVYTPTGKWVGKIEKISKDKGTAEFTLKKQKVTLSPEDFNLNNGKVLLRRNVQ
ncbi:MAG: DUF373 family protein [Candidatus Diapherotrites archaeon]|nr:DUF373 family protein [Candidatus Diapherotrites archaeon]MDZ4256483.1 DUF373 family protein [archaeon]